MATERKKLALCRSLLTDGGEPTTRGKMRSPTSAPGETVDFDPPPCPECGGVMRDHRRPSPRRPTASVREAAVLVRHFMSATMTIQPTISLRVSPIAPPIGGRRSDLYHPHAVAACIPQHWRALPAQANPDLLPIAHQNDHARLAWRQADATTTRSYPTQSPIATPARTPAPSFNPASMRSAPGARAIPRRGPHRSL